MIKKKKFVVIILVILILSILSSNNVYAIADTSSLEIYCPNVLLVERKTGKILYEKNSKEKIYMASTTKLLTAILVLENCTLTEKATVSSTAVNSVPLDYTRANLRAGEQFTVDELMHLLLIPSANDAANVLAEHVSGSVEEFAKLMNKRAKELGCTDSNFTNPSGLHNENHYSTAYDLYLIGNKALEFEKIREIVMETKYTLPPTDIYDKDDRKFVTTNSMIREDMPKYYNPYVTGLKTGYTDFSKDCIVASCEKDGIEYIAVAMGGGYTGDEWLREKYLDCKTLFDFAFDNYTIQALANQGNICTKITIGNATKETQELDIVYKDKIEAFMDKNTPSSDISPSIKLNDNIKAPIQKGDKLGTATYTIDGITYSSDLIANSDVQKIPIFVTIIKIGFIPFILFGALFIFYYVQTKNKKEKKNYRL